MSLEIKLTDLTFVVLNYMAMIRLSRLNKSKMLIKN